MKNVIVRLSKKNNPSKYFDLKFKLLDNAFVKKWARCVLIAQQNNLPISEPWAIYNINKDLDENFIKNNINRLIKEVDNVQKLFGLEVTNLKDQDTLNKVHAIFEKHHGKLNEWKTNPLFVDKPKSFRKNLSEINQFVHACESTVSGTPKIRIVWFDLPKLNKFSDEDYNLFTNEVNFGSLYHLYCDVGKNIESLVKDNDQHHHDFVPNIHYSADCVCYFKKEDQKKIIDLEKSYKDYIKKNYKKLASKGYYENDKRLTTGRIELAKLDMNMSEDKLLKELQGYNYIQSFLLI